MIPLYLTMKSLGWINTYQGIAAPYLIMSFGIFLMRQHIATASRTSYHLLSAAAVLNTVPMLIAFIVLRRRIMESVALTGLKG
jgi:ABC-type glycerol-3-phosphate transport system permease component